MGRGLFHFRPTFRRRDGVRGPAQWAGMSLARRLVLLACAFLAVVTPLLAGAHAWRYVDEAWVPQSAEPLLLWPSLLIAALPARAEEVLTASALPTVLLYFAGYLLMCHGAVTLWRLRR